MPTLQMRKLRVAEGRWLCLVFQLLVTVFSMTLSSLGSGVGCLVPHPCPHTAVSGLSAGVLASWEDTFLKCRMQLGDNCRQGLFLIKALSPVTPLPENLGILTKCLGCFTGVQLLDPGQGLTASQECRGNWIPFMELVNGQYQALLFQIGTPEET